MNSPMQNGKISKRPPMQDNNYIGGVVVSRKKGMKKNPQGIRETVISGIRAGESRNAMSRE